MAAISLGVLKKYQKSTLTAGFSGTCDEPLK
jgi:hypothetical protein